MAFHSLRLSADVPPKKWNGMTDVYTFCSLAVIALCVWPFGH